MMTKASKLKRSLIFFCCLAAFSCKDKTNTGSVTDSFERFYEQFHQDSTFQLAHIIFPLKGISTDGDSMGRDPNFHWQEDQWVLHKPFREDSGFERTWTEVGDGLITETIVQPQAQVGMERRFARLEDGWYLIYYAGLNKLRVAK